MDSRGRGRLEEGRRGGRRNSKKPSEEKAFGVGEEDGRVLLFLERKIPGLGSQRQESKQGRAKAKKRSSQPHSMHCPAQRHQQRHILDACLTIQPPWTVDLSSHPELASLTRRHLLLSQSISKCHSPHSVSPPSPATIQSSFPSPSSLLPSLPTTSTALLAPPLPNV